MPDLWALVWGRQYIDPVALADAIDREVACPSLDTRTRLLIRDGVRALEDYWGTERYQGWLRNTRHRARIEAIREEPLGEPGFPLLREALVEPTRPERIRQLLRELGNHVHRPTQLVIGSCALILTGYLLRATQVIDVVDEVPAELRDQHGLLADLTRRYRLHLAHFQSHFLPSGWETRVHSLEPFGKLQASLVDVTDIFLSKLFSGRDKDRDDLRELLPALDRAAVKARLAATCAAFLGDPALRVNAEKNWYVLTGEELA